MKIGIVGLGLMGGSFGLSLKKSLPGVYVVGYDHSESHREKALSLGLVDEIVDFDGIKTCDVIVLAIPVEGIIKALKSLEDISSETTVIDLGSTKAKIVEACPPKIRQNFVAAHPMAGREKFGPSAAIADLYRDKIVVLCDLEENALLHSDRAIEIFEALGMVIVYMKAKEHDRHAAYISHMPHAVSFALANSVMEQEDPRSILALAAGGFKDMSRIAKSSPQMWSDIFMQNSDNLLEAITSFQTELQKMREMVESKDEEALNAWMKRANELHKIL
ncbi:MAG: prephenate dehydrogenase [Sulfurospirillum sp.]|nr:MAG: prephenate dehydrogenase [Sulfurospirillum sp.]